jgi:hypothetical protein
MGVLAYAALNVGTPPSGAEMPDSCQRHFAAGRLWRVRRGPLSITVCGASPRVVHMRLGNADVAVGVQVAHGGPRGRVECGRLTVDGSTATLLCPHAPLEDLLPLARPVPPEQWDAVIRERAVISRPSADVTLTVRDVQPAGESLGGVDIRVLLPHPVAGVLTQVALDFLPGDVWQADGCAFAPRAGQVVFLTAGRGAMRYGNHWLAVSGGSDGHRTWKMRGSEIPPDRVRVIVPLVTPVDHVLRLRGFASPVLPAE